MQTERTICFLLLPHVHLLDLAGPIQVFYEASRMGPVKYKLHFAGAKPEVRSEQGLLLAELLPFDTLKLQAGDFVIVPGIDFKAFQQQLLHEEIKILAPWLHQNYRNGISIASICSGMLVLAQARLLDGKKCTTHWKCIDYVKRTFPQVKVQIDQLYVKDRAIYTSAGMTSGIDMALSLIEQEQGPVITAKVAREIVVFMRRNHNDRQQTIYLDYKTHFNPAIHKVQDYIISNPAKNPALDELAALSNISVRNLTRLFKQATGHTIIEFKNTVKAELAYNLVHNREYTMEKIASLCGFQNVRQLRRIMKKGKVR